MKKPAEAGQLALCLRALAHPVRLAILNMLTEGVQCNCEISASLGLSLSLISHHTRLLRECGLVKAERDTLDARWIYYSLDQPVLSRLRDQLTRLLDAQRIKPRHPSCGPRHCEPDAGNAKMSGGGQTDVHAQESSACAKSKTRIDLEAKA